MNEMTEQPGFGPPPGGSPPAERAELGPISRFVNVLFSPGRVFEDVRRDHSRWWVPIVILAVATSIFGSLYVSRYDMTLVLREQLRESAGMKLVAGLQGPEARDKALEAAMQQVKATPRWQMQISQWTNSLVGWTLVAWFFAFLYGLIALAGGWLGEARASRLWINLLAVAGVMVVFMASMGVLQVLQQRGMRQGMEEGGALSPPSTGLIVAGLVIAAVATALVFWSLFRLARESAFGRILAVVTYSSAPAAIAALVGMAIVFIRTPDVTPLEQLVPADLTSLLNLREGNAVLASIGSSIGLFSLWSVVLAIIGLAKVLGRRTGQAASIVLIPWVAWLVLKAGWAAIVG